MTPEEVLRSAGLAYHQYGDELVAKCPAHKARTGKEDRRPSWSVNYKTGAHHCFSCGWGGDLDSLRELLDVAFTRPPRLPPTSRGARWDEVMRDRLTPPKSTPAPEKAPDPGPISWEDFFEMSDEPPRRARVKRGISAEVCQRYKIRVSKTEPVWVYPIVGAQGQCLGWQEKRTGFSRNYPRGVKAHESVFGIDQARAWDTPAGVIVMESPLDAARLATFGYPSTVALYGSSPSQSQVDIVWEAAGDRPVVVLLDDDAAGQRGVEQFAKHTRGNGRSDRLYVVRLHGYGGGDPAALTRRQVEEVIGWAFEERYILTRLKRLL